MRRTLRILTILFIGAIPMTIYPQGSIPSIYTAIEENKGQYNHDALFVAKTKSYHILFEANSVEIVLHPLEDKRQSLILGTKGELSTPVAHGRSSSAINYYNGKDAASWILDVHPYGSIQYTDDQGFSYSFRHMGGEISLSVQSEKKQKVRTAITLEESTIALSTNQEYTLKYLLQENGYLDGLDEHIQNEVNIESTSDPIDTKSDLNKPPHRPSSTPHILAELLARRLLTI